MADIHTTPYHRKFIEGQTVVRVAAIYDVHGNLPALEAVVAEIRKARVDRVVVGGDVLPGPMARDVLSYLLNFNLPGQFIYGNGEVAVLEQLAGRTPAAVPEQFLPAIEWTARQVAEYQQTLSAWPMTACIEIPGLGRVLFCHATPRSEDEAFTRLTPENRLLPIFETIEASVVVCGHTHMQFDRMIGRTRVVNAGSVGMPFGNPGAYWLLLGSDVQLRHTSYDLANAAECVRRTEYPEAEDFAARSILKPPSEPEMLEAITKLELS